MGDCRQERKKRVAVLGAGITGIVSCKILLDHPERFEVSCWEKTDQFGGEWNYTENITLTEDDRPNAMYSYLKTNSNCVNNSLPGLEISQKHHWNTHREVISYLQEYVEKFDLKKHIQFNTKVENVSCVKQNDGSELWKIVTKSKDGKVKESMHDAVIVGTGQYKRANRPHYEGEEMFEGEILHSCQYRRPHRFEGKTVLTIGGCTSGQDITDQISMFANKVYNNTNLPIEKRENVFQTKAKYIKSFKKNSVVMEDGEELEVDAVVLCTGYHVEFPSLDKSCEIDVVNTVVYPLYKMFVNARHPTMFFNCLYRLTPHLLLAGMVAQCTVKILLGEAILPTPAEMKADIDGEIEKYKKAGRPLKTLPFLIYLDGSFKFVKDLAELGNLPYPADNMAFHSMLLKYSRLRKINVFRRFEFSMGDDGKVIETPLPEAETSLYRGYDGL